MPSYCKSPISSFFAQILSARPRPCRSIMVPHCGSNYGNPGFSFDCASAVVYSRLSNPLSHPGPGRELIAVNIDEELTLLDENLRRLKVEYDIFFGGGSKKPPSDVEWRVQNLLRKYSDGSKLNFAQRFRFNTIQQRYALFAALWKQKLQIKEEGYRRPQDAVLGIQGMRGEEQHAAEKA